METKARGDRPGALKHRADPGPRADGTSDPVQNLVPRL
jgi:hypothetical protein